MDQYRYINLPHFESVIENNPNYSRFVQIKIPDDNNSLLHSIFRATSLLYNDEETIIKDADGIEKVVRIYKHSLISNERFKLSRILSLPISDDPGSSTYYDIISKKPLSTTLSNKIPEIYSISQMKKRLEDIKKSVGVEFLQFLTLVYNVNIYVLHQYTKDIYQVGFAGNNSHNNNKSIVLLLSDHNHFDLIGLWYNNGVISCFDGDNIFIKTLNARRENYLNLP